MHGPVHVFAQREAQLRRREALPHVRDLRAVIDERRGVRGDGGRERVDPLVGRSRRAERSIGGRPRVLVVVGRLVVASVADARVTCRGRGRRCVDRLRSRHDVLHDRGDRGGHVLRRVAVADAVSVLRAELERVAEHARVALGLGEVVHHAAGIGALAAVVDRSPGGCGDANALGDAAVVGGHDLVLADAHADGRDAQGVAAGAVQPVVCATGEDVPVTAVENLRGTHVAPLDEPLGRRELRRIRDRRRRNGRVDLAGVVRLYVRVGPSVGVRHELVFLASGQYGDRGHGGRDQGEVGDLLHVYFSSRCYRCGSVTWPFVTRIRVEMNPLAMCE